MKLSFKKLPQHTGLMGVGHPHRTTQIKIDGKVVGSIVPPTWQSSDDNWIIMIATVKKNIMEDGNPNCVWKWLQLKSFFASEPEAREYLKKNKDFIFRKLALYFFED